MFFVNLCYYMTSDKLSAKDGILCLWKCWLTIIQVFLSVGPCFVGRMLSGTGRTKWVIQNHFTGIYPTSNAECVLVLFKFKCVHIPCFFGNVYTFIYIYNSVILMNTAWFLCLPRWQRYQRYLSDMFFWSARLIRLFQDRRMWVARCKCGVAQGVKLNGWNLEMMGFPNRNLRPSKGPPFSGSNCLFFGGCVKTFFFWRGAIYLRAISDMMIHSSHERVWDIIHEITTDRRNQYENGFGVWSFFRTCWSLSVSIGNFWVTIRTQELPMTAREYMALVGTSV